MRALALLAIVVLAFLTVRWLVPGTDPVEAGGGTGEAAPAEAGASFLQPPPRSAPEPVATEAARQTSAPSPEPEADTSRFLPAPSLLAGELEAARALAHGTPADVELASAALPPGRARLLVAFAWAAAGERQMAQSLAARLERGEVDAREGALLTAALEGKGLLPAGAKGATPVEFAMEMALLAREAEAALAGRSYPAAAKAFSSLLIAELEAPFPSDPAALTRWTDGLNRAQREHRWNPQGSWPAAEVSVESGDTLIRIRQRYLATRPEARLCTGLLERANRLAGMLQPGQKLRIPTDGVRVMVDLEARWLLYFLGDEVAAAWPVGIGRAGEDTPPGSYTAIEKTEKPSWMKVGQEPIPFGDPRNPLGTRWIGWARQGAKTTYGFHGTSEPDSIGRAASDGCVRLLNEDVEELFQILPEGAPIEVQG